MTPFEFLQNSADAVERIQQLEEKIQEETNKGDKKNGDELTKLRCAQLYQSLNLQWPH